MPYTFRDLAPVLDAYLEVFPAERAELAGLAAQIRDGDENLFSRTNMRGHICASGLVLNTAQDRVLFIHHKASDFWMQPGGHFENNDAGLWEAACREVMEETGLADLRAHPWHTDHPVPFDIHTHPIEARPDKGEGAHQHYDCMYLMIADREETALQAEEIGGIRWIPLGELPAYPGQRLRNRFLPKLRQVPALTPAL